MPPSESRAYFLLRHGETQWNRDQRVMGRRDIPLSESGQAQVLELAPHLARLGITRIFTSPLARARATADLVAGHLDRVEVIEDAGLTEVDYAGWEGKTLAELVRDPAYHAFQASPLAAPIPGSCERLLDVRDRVLEAMQRMAAVADPGPTLVVSHGDPLRMILCSCLGLDPANLRRLRVENGALSSIEWGPQWTEVRFLNVRPRLDGSNSFEVEGARAVRDHAAAPRRD